LTSLVPLIAITVYLMGVEQAHLMFDGCGTSLPYESAKSASGNDKMKVRHQAGAAKELLNNSLTNY